MNVDSSPVHVLSLCAGGGGLDLGVRMACPSARTVCFVEIEAFACATLAKAMEEGGLDEAPIWTDLRTFDGRPWRGVVDLVTAGYPCQPFSQAGKRAGADDPRHLWPEVARVIRECEPEGVFLENVPGHLSLGAREVIGELQGMGYRVAAGLYRAEEVGAPHRRERLFILAHSEGLGSREGRTERAGREREPAPLLGSGSVADSSGGGGQRRGERGDLARAPGDSEGEGRERERSGDAARDRGEALANDDDGREGFRRGGVLDGERASRWNDPHGRYVPFPPGPGDVEGWREYLARWPSLEPAVLRGSDELADRLDRLRLLGNGVVPPQAARALIDLAEALT